MITKSYIYISRSSIKNENFLAFDAPRTASPNTTETKHVDNFANLVKILGV